MAAREWLLPAGLGAAVLLGLLAWGPGQAPEPEPATDLRVPLRFPFLAGPVLPAGCPGPEPACRPTVLAIAGGNTTARQVLAAHPGEPQVTLRAVLPAPEAVQWQTARVGRLVPAQGEDRCGPDGCTRAVGPATAAPVEPGGARLGQDGAWAAAFTFYAFRPDGKLLASNAPDAQVLRFDLDGDYTQLPRATYWLGDGPAPNGTRPVPEQAQGLVRELRGDLAGLPEGGIATRLLERYPYAGIFGPLWVTLRIDALAPAP
jgi:hypothetical protein